MFISRSALKNLFFYLNLSICGILLFGYLLINNLYAVSLGKHSAYISRDLSNGKGEITIEFTLTGLKNTDTSDNIYNSIEIQFPEYTKHGTDSIPDESKESESIQFVKKLNRSPIDIVENNSDYEASVSIIIRETKENSLKSLVNNNKVKIKIFYGSTDLTQTDFYAIIPSPINAAPNLTTITSGFRSIKVDWEVPTEKLPHVKTDSNEASIPTNMDIIVLPVSNESSSYPFPTIKYGGDSQDTQAKECNILLNPSYVEGQMQNCFDGSTCSNTGENYYYLDTSIKSDGVVNIVKDVSVSKGTTTIGGLNTNTKYLIFAQYQPNGVVRSLCGVATPYTNYSFSEFYEGTNSKEDDISCFIATAAYGSAFTKELKILRWFRDTYLKSNSVGKKLVNLYYKYSPRVAKKIQDSPVLAKITRTFLYIPVGISYLLFLLNPTSPSVIGLVILMIILGLSTLVIRKLYK